MDDQADQTDENKVTAAAALPGTAAQSESEQTQDRPRARLKIGSQRQASGIFRAKPQIGGGPPQPEAPARVSTPPTAAVSSAPPVAAPPVAEVATPAGASASTDEASSPNDAPGLRLASALGSSPGHPAAPPVAPARTQEETPRPQPVAPPTLRETMTDDLEEELAAAMGGVALDEMLASPAAATSGVELEADSIVRGRVLFVRGSDVFIDLGGRNQGTAPAPQFEVLPKAGDMLEVSVRKFDQAEGLYELSVPHAAISVAGWDQLSEGMVVDATVTGHNAGGLEVEVNKLRGFIPISQVSLYRVEGLAEFVGQRFTCVVTEVNPEARNLVLSRRAMLERERAEAKTKLIQEIDVGQTREGVVTRLQPFGAFVDLGGIDGLIHVSQMSWDRVADPSQVLAVGQKIQVRVTKMDRETGKIGLSYREKWENPWETVASRFPPKTKVSGTVSKLMEFGAFVRLDAGVEGLIHISELAHRRVFRASDVVKEGQEVEVLVLSVDQEQQRISLSLKALEARPEPAGKKKEEEDEAIPTPIPPRKNQGPLKGGVTRPSGGEQFGLKW